jgi:hypothetical protein
LLDLVPEFKLQREQFIVCPSPCSHRGGKASCTRFCNAERFRCARWNGEAQREGGIAGGHIPKRANTGAVLQGRLSAPIKYLSEEISVNDSALSGVMNDAAQRITTSSNRPLQIRLSTGITLRARSELQIADAQFSSPKWLGQPKSEDNQSNQEGSFHL